MYDWVRIALEKRNPGTWRGPCHKPAGTPEGGQFTGEKPCVEGGEIEGIEHRITQEIYKARKVREERSKKKGDMDVFSPSGHEFIEDVDDVEPYIDWILDSWRDLMRRFCRGYGTVDEMKFYWKDTLLTAASRIKDDDERRGFVYEYLRDAFNVMEEVFREETGMQLMDKVYDIIDSLRLKQNIAGDTKPKSLLELFFRVDDRYSDWPHVLKSLWEFSIYSATRPVELDTLGLKGFRREDAQLFALLLDAFSSSFLDEWRAFVQYSYWDDEKLLNALRKAKSRTQLRLMLARAMKDALKCPIEVYRGERVKKEFFPLVMATPSMTLRRIERLGLMIMERTQRYLKSAAGRRALSQKGFLSAKDGYIRVYRGLQTPVITSSILDSWSGDYQVAYNFYLIGGAGGLYAVDVPIESVLVCLGAPDWRGMLTEDEFVVVGREDYLRRAMDISWHDSVRRCLVPDVVDSVRFREGVRRFGYDSAVVSDDEARYDLLALREGEGVSEEFVKHTFCSHNMYLALQRDVPLGRLFYRESNDQYIFLMHDTSGGKILSNMTMSDELYWSVLDYLRKDFLVDAFLRNWDVLGEDGSNIWVGWRTMPDVWRMNCSGVGEYRADGRKKEGGLTGFVTDIWRMRSGELVKKHRSIYGKIHIMDIRNSINDFLQQVRNSAFFEQVIDERQKGLYRERLEFLRDLRKVLDYYSQEKGEMSWEDGGKLKSYYIDAEKRYRSYLDFAREWNGFRGEDDLRRFWKKVLEGGISMEGG